MTALARGDGGWRGGWRSTVPLFLWLGLILVLAWLVFHYFILTFAVAGSVALLLGPAQAALTRRFRVPLCGVAVSRMSCWFGFLAMRLTK